MSLQVMPQISPELHLAQDTRVLALLHADLVARAQAVEEAREPRASLIAMTHLAEGLIVTLGRAHGVSRPNPQRLLLALQDQGYLPRDLAGVLHLIFAAAGHYAARPLSENTPSPLPHIVPRPALLQHAQEDLAQLIRWCAIVLRPDLGWDAPLDHLAQTPAPQNPWAPSALMDAEMFNKLRRIQTRARAFLSAHFSPLHHDITLQEAFDLVLAPDQLRALSEIEAFFADPAQDIFLLKGYAGTGKTTLVRGLASYLMSRGQQIRLTAPTGRAARVISAKTALPATTLDSQIYDFENAKHHYDPVTQTTKMISHVLTGAWAEEGVLIVDEASMVSDVENDSETYQSGSGKLLQDLLSYMSFDELGARRKVVMIGDPAQLTPVNMLFSPALDAAYLQRVHKMRVRSYEMREVLRQKAGSLILENVAPLREDLRRRATLADPEPSITFFHDGGSVIDLRAAQIVPCYLRVRQENPARHPLIITRSNKEAATRNRALRAALFPGQQLICPQDRVVVMENTYRGGHFVANGEFLTITRVASEVDAREVYLPPRKGQSPQTVPLVFREIGARMLTLDQEVFDFDALILDSYLHRPEQVNTTALLRALALDFQQRNPHLDPQADIDAYSMALKSDPYVTALRLRFGYAVTCHKAQGGEWADVIVDAPPFGQWSDSSEKLRWYYTALTRAQQRLYLVNVPKIQPASKRVSP